MDDSARIERIEVALERAGLHERPIAVLDLDAFEANADALVRRAAGTPIRVASKSLRVRDLIERTLKRPGFQGVLAYTLPEALWLVRHGITDVLVAYPSADRDAWRELASNDAARREIAVMVDEPAHLDFIEDACQGLLSDAEPLRLCLELDAAYAPAPRIRFGALRSPMRTPSQVLALAREIEGRRGLRVVGLMAYEGQIAGVGDAARTPYGMAVRTMKRLSGAEIARRRQATVHVLSQICDLELVNAGGTGSIETSRAEECVSEVAAGSGLIGPGIFDHYRAFCPQAALLLGFSVVRRPAPAVATVLGGGWIASGPPAADRLPVLWHPRGLRYAPQEAAGEVQTPVLGAAADRLRVGDTVWMRHAKSGEPAEHAQHYHLLRGEEIIASAPTYRGEGKMFL